MVRNDERADWGAAWALFPGSIAYVWHGALHAATVADSLAKQGFTIRAQIISAKERLVIGRGDYHWQHKPCWYAVRTKGNWTGDRKQTTLWTIPSGRQDIETTHGTQKPVECMRRPLLNNSSPGQAVYDPFLGSGTTVIAAETTGRACLAMELDPLYVDVAVRRWQAFTGESATLGPGGPAFDAIAQERLPGPGQAHTCKGGEAPAYVAAPHAKPTSAPENATGAGDRLAPTAQMGGEASPSSPDPEQSGRDAAKGNSACEDDDRSP